MATKLIKVYVALITVLFLSEAGSLIFAQDSSFSDHIPSNIEGRIFNIVDSFEKGGIFLARKNAQSSGIKLSQDNIRVIMESDPGIDVASGLQIPGVTVEGRYKNLTQVLASVSCLRKLTAVPGVRFIRLPLRKHLEVISEGVTLVKANKWHDAGYKGRGVKIAVFDIGFDGYENLRGKELPRSAIVKSFYESPSGNGDITGDGEDHGTACAEIVYDMAPEAQLYLVNASNEFEDIFAVNWLIEQGVNIISCSTDYVPAPSDGTGLSCDTVNKAGDKDILWVNAAGNYAQRHYEGAFNDSNNNKWHEFSPGDESISIQVEDVFDTISIALSWNDWPTTDQDYDLYLYDSRGTEVYRSTDRQTGSQPPKETIDYFTFSSGTYSLKVKEYKASKKNNIEIYSLSHNFSEHNVAAGSITTPGDAARAFTVGAYSWKDGILEPFSSRGPTNDGRIKPDICGPDRVSSATYGSFPPGFAGTSAATPHVAGAAAIVKAWRPNFTANDIRDYLEKNAINLGSPGKDNQSGWGRLNFPEPKKNTPPVATDLYITPEKPYTTDNLKCNYTYRDADGNPEDIAKTEIIWYKDGNPQASQNNKRTVLSSATSKKQKWHFTVKPHDGTDSGDLKKSPEVTILNSVPSLSTPPTITVTNGLLCSYTYSDADNDLEKGTEIRWYKDNNPQPAHNDKNTVPFSAIAKGQKWYVTVKPKDGEEFGKMGTSPEIVVSNIPPVASNLTITPEKPRTTDDLVCSYTYSDADNDLENGSEIRWYKDNNPQPAYNDIKTLPASATAKGQSWYFKVKPKDGADFGEEKKSSAVTILNTPPEVSGVVLNPSSPRTKDDLVLDYKYYDADGDADKSEIKWYKNDILQVEYNSKKTVPASITAKGQKWQSTIRPGDGEYIGELVSSSAVIILNTPPVAGDLAITPTALSTMDNLSCSYTYSDADRDVESGTEIKWYKDGVPQTGYNDKKAVPANATTKGQRWYFTVRPKDGEEFGEEEKSPAVIIINTPPVASNLTIIPSAPVTTDDLVCRYSYSDVDDDAESGTEIKWYKDGVPQTGYNKAVPASVTAKGQRWHFTVRPKDGEDFGEEKKSPVVTILNTPPVASSLTIIPSAPVTTDDLVYNYIYSDADNDAERDTEIKWYKDGVLQAGYNDKKAVPASATEKGQRWHFSVRPKDGESFGEEKTSPVVTIINTPPVASSLTIIPSAPVTTDDLVCRYSYSDADNDAESGTEIRWYKNDVLQIEYNDKRTVPASATAKVWKWHFTVRPKDGESFGELKTSPALTILNTPPVASNLTIIPLAPITTDDLVCNYAYSDADNDTESGTEIKWYKDGVLQAEYNNEVTVPASATTKHEKWHFTVKPKDGESFGEMKTSPVVTIPNPLPVVSNPTIIPSAPVTIDNLVCIYSYSDVENDPESGTEIRWYKDSVLQVEYNNKVTVSASSTAKGQRWHFTVRPKDGEDFGEEKKSPVVEILNTPPVASNLTIIPLAPVTTDNLVCNYAYSDADNDPESGTEIRWYKDDAPQAEYNGEKTVPASATARDQKWRVTVRPKDGIEFGELKEFEVTIADLPPVAGNLTITPSTLYTADDLVCSYTYSDMDNDAEGGTEIGWYKNDVLQEKYNNVKVVPASATTKHEKWLLTVKPKDGTLFGAIQTSDKVTILNTPASVSNVAITPSSPVTTDDLICKYTYNDADGDAEIGTEVRWYKNDALQAEYNDKKAVPASATAKGQRWHVTIRPKDGEEFGELGSSDVITIINTPPVADNPNITPKSPLTTDDLTCNYGYSDIDADAENGSEIRWYMNGNLQTAYSDKITLPASATEKDQRWHFSVRPRDGEDFGEEKISSPATIGNSVPVVSDPVITPASPLTTDDLMCKYSFSDADNDVENGTEIRWYKNSILQSAYNDKKAVPASVTAKGQKWHYTVRPKDSALFGDMKTSGAVTIGNTIPAVSDLKISPPSKETGYSLVGSYTYKDADDDTDNGTEIRWYENDVLKVAHNDTLEIPPSALAVGQKWYFTVKPKDGSEFGTLQTSQTEEVKRLPWDVNSDGTVGIMDFVIVGQHYGEDITKPMTPNPDVNENGKVDVSDFVLVGEYFTEEIGTGNSDLCAQHQNELVRIYNIIKANPIPGSEYLNTKDIISRLIDNARISKTEAFQNYPNPSADGTWIPYRLAMDSVVTIRIFNLPGQLVRHIDLGEKKMGLYMTKDTAAYWDLRNDVGERVAKGIYFCSVHAGDYNVNKKIVVVR